MYSLPPTRYSSTVCSVSLLMVTSGAPSGATSGPASNAGGGGSGSRLPGTGFWAKAAREKQPSSKKDRNRIAVTSMNCNKRILADVGRNCAAMCKPAQVRCTRYNPPCLELALMGNGGIRRAGGRQAQVLDGFNFDVRMHMLAVALLCLGAIEKNMVDLWVMPEKRCKVVRDKRFIIDMGIQAAFAAA